MGEDLQHVERIRLVLIGCGNPCSLGMWWSEGNGERKAWFCVHLSTQPQSHTEHLASRSVTCVALLSNSCSPVCLSSTSRIPSSSDAISTCSLLRVGHDPAFSAPKCFKSWLLLANSTSRSVNRVQYLYSFEIGRPTRLAKNSRLMVGQWSREP